jgi:hypothetical protein
MNITDLYDKEQKDKELGYDLKDDLVFFMNNDPQFYRKKYYPTMLKFDKFVKEGKRIDARGFVKLVKEAYSTYQNKFPVEGLKEELPEDMLEDICKAIHDQETKNVEDKFYDED